MEKAEQVELLNMIANQPEILCWIAPGHEHIDLTEFFERDGNLMLGNARGVILFVNLGESIYACHWLLTSSLRGRDAMTAIRMAFTSLFTNRDATAITGMIPHENRASRVMAHALGCRPIGECLDSHGRACTSFIMERTRWAILSGA